MQKQTPTYSGDQYDQIEADLDAASKLMEHPDTRKEGRDLLCLTALRIKRETNRMNYARLTHQEPNIPPLEPAPDRKQLKG